MAVIAVIGGGAIGGLVAARLMLSGEHRVAVATRTPIEVLEVTYDDATFKVVPSLIDSGSARSPREWVFVATKAYDSEAAARWFPNLVGPNTTVAILQNGVEHLERFSRYLPSSQILPVVVALPAERPAPGRVVQHGAGKLTVPASRSGEEFSRLFIGSGIEVSEVEDFTTAAWTKLCLNAVGAISALALSSRISARDPLMASLIYDVVNETMLVGTAEGAQLSSDLAKEIVHRFVADEPQGVNSMLADRLAGRRLETDARNGAVVRLGKAHGIPTPANRALVALLRAAAPPTAG